MKNKSFLKTPGNTMKNKYFWSNFEMNDIDFLQMIKVKCQKRMKSRIKSNEMKMGKCRENTGILTLSDDDQKRKIKLFRISS